jgi:hypothetical protein
MFVFTCIHRGSTFTLTNLFFFCRWNLCTAAAIFRSLSHLSTCTAWARALRFPSPAIATSSAPTSHTPASAHAQTTLASIADLHPTTIYPQALRVTPTIKQDRVLSQGEVNIIQEIHSTRPSTRFPTIPRLHRSLSLFNRNLALRPHAVLPHALAGLGLPLPFLRPDPAVAIHPTKTITCILA